MRKLIKDDRLNIKISKDKKEKYREYCKTFKEGDMTQDVTKYIDRCIEDLEDFKKKQIRENRR